MKYLKIITVVAGLTLAFLGSGSSLIAKENGSSNESNKVKCTQNGNCGTTYSGTQIVGRPHVTAQG